jgi:hypothetical protein
MKYLCKSISVIDDKYYILTEPQTGKDDDLQMILLVD